jgi:hypothetical protein
MQFCTPLRAEANVFEFLALSSLCSTQHPPLFFRTIEVSSLFDKMINLPILAKEPLNSILGRSPSHVFLSSHCWG